MKIYKEAVSDGLWEALVCLMNLEVFQPFRLVGGTSLSLMLGHRRSVDIDLFTDAPYGTIDFKKIEEVLNNTFPYVKLPLSEAIGFGMSYFVGKSKDDAIKLDLFYTEPFIRMPILYNSIRMSNIEEIAAMKLEVVANTGRKKDFWDIHELLEHFSISQLIGFYFERYPYSHGKSHLIYKLTDFSEADSDFDPICLKQKYWELVKLDIEDAVSKI